MRFHHAIGDMSGLCGFLEFAVVYQVSGEFCIFVFKFDVDAEGTDSICCELEFLCDSIVNKFSGERIHSCGSIGVFFGDL